MDEQYVRLYPDLEKDHFWWRIRRELVAGLIEKLRPIQGATVLDIGCGSGFTLEHLQDLGASFVQGVEVDASALRSSAQINDNIVVGDFMTVDLVGKFDIVLMLDVLEHLRDDRAALDRAVDMMGEGGALVLTVPAYMVLWSNHDERNRHYRRYRRNDLLELAAECKLEVIRCGYMFTGLVLPKLLISLLERIGRTESTANSHTQPNAFLARIAYRWFGIESKLALTRNRLLPFGTSAVLLATKVSDAG
jgi:SAM-dependent methyltransferase